MREDLIKRLAAANPVPESYGLTPARTKGQPVQMTVVALGAAAIAAAIGSMFLASSTSHRGSTGSPPGLQGPAPVHIGPLNGPTGANGPTGGFYGPTGWTLPATSNRVWTPIALTDVSASLGAPVLLPEAPPLPPSDRTGARATALCPPERGESTSTCNVAVHFPSSRVVVLYTRTTYGDPRVVYRADRDAYKERSKIAYIGGVPAFVITNPDDHAHPSDNWSFVEFVVSGTTVALIGSDTATLEKLAKSIVDQTIAAEHGATARRLRRGGA